MLLVKTDTKNIINEYLPYKDATSYVTTRYTIPLEAENSAVYMLNNLAVVKSAGDTSMTMAG